MWTVVNVDSVNVDSVKCVLGPVNFTEKDIFTFVVEETEISQDEPLPLPQTHPRTVLQRETRRMNDETKISKDWRTKRRKRKKRTGLTFVSFHSPAETSVDLKGCDHLNF